VGVLQIEPARLVLPGIADEENVVSRF